MGDSIFVLVAVGGGVACMALALWIWKKAEPPAAPPATTERRSDPQDELGTVVIPTQDMFANQTVSLDQDAAARAVAPAPAAASDAGTEFVPREEIFAVADRARAAESETDQPPSQASPATEVISRDEVMAIIEAARAKRPESPPELAAPPPSPSPTVKPTRVLTSAFIPAPPRPSVAIPTPTPRAPAPAPTGPDISLAVLREQFDASVDALARIVQRSDSLADLVGGPLAKWRGNLELLALAGPRSATELLLPILDDPDAPEHRRTAAALVLLHLREFDGPSALLERAGAHHDDAKRAIVTALAHWDSPRLETVLGKALANASAADKPRWWQVFSDRALDPGPALVAELLASKNPEHAQMGLELLCVHADRAAHAGAVDRYAFSSHTPLKTAAIQAGLTLGRPSAAVVCKQAAHDPKCPDACLLHAVLANDKEFDSLLAWATNKGAPAHAAWALGYSGRRGGIEACLTILRAGGTDVDDDALAGFRAATGFVGERADAHAWWAENQGGFAPGTRYLRGRAADLDSTKLALREADARSWRCYRLELLVRSKGEVRLPTVAMPDQFERAVDAVTIALA